MVRWKGFAKAKVWKKVKENEGICSLYMKIDGQEGELPAYEAGQFISIRVPFLDGGYSKVRQYTLSSIENGSFYRITVKREEEGEVSRLLCDTIEEEDYVEITAPAGAFVLKETEGPVVLIGGGIGITPMLTMAMKRAQSQEETHLIYSLPNGESVVFLDEIQELKEDNPKLKTTIAYSRPRTEDVPGKDYQHSGRLTQEWLAEHVNADAEFYFCGPVEFMRTMYHSLRQIGVSEDKIHFELFQPGVDIRKERAS